MKTKTEVKTYKVDCICDNCGNGEMRPTGIAYMVSPPKYPHVCNKCGHKDTYQVKYPYTAYE